jgi:branched-chain amino acid transport system substrate-binding protein
MMFRFLVMVVLFSPGYFSNFAVAQAISPNATGEIKIGVIAPLSGSEELLGSYIVKATKLAIKGVNSNGGINGRKLVLVVEDNKSSNQGTVEALQKLIKVTPVAIISPSKTPQCNSMGPLVGRSGIPTFMGGTGSRVFEQTNGWAFRTRVSEVLGVQAMVDFAVEDLKAKKIAILHDVDAFGSGGANLIEKFAKHRHVAIVKRQSIETDQKNFKPLLEAIKIAGADALLVYSNRSLLMAQLENQYHESNMPFAFVGSPASLQVEALAAAKKSAEGIYGYTDVVPGSSEANRKFIEAYRLEYKEDPNMALSYGFDAVNVLAAAINKVGEDPSNLKEAILSTKDFQGYIGRLNFDSTGNSLHEASIVKIERGSPKLIRVVKQSE